MNAKQGIDLRHQLAKHDTAMGKKKSNLQLALDDLREGLLNIHLWPMLGWQDVKQRYRRSVLGPFWLTLSTAVIIGGMGPLYSKLFNQQLNDYLPFLAVGFVVWQLISLLVSDACTAFITAEAFIKQVRLPLTIYIMRIVWKNLIIFFHNFAIVILVLAYFKQTLDWHLLLFPLALFIFAANFFWIAMILALVCARFRDIPQIAINVVQLAFFLTPVMWQPSLLGRHAWTVNLNPFYHFVEIVRAPLLNGPSNSLSWIVVCGISVLGFAMTIALLSRFRARVAYWV